MFERYSERSRRIIFFARYEALQYGSPVIAPEHVLLGLLREDKTVVGRFFPFRSDLGTEKIRAEIEERVVVRDRIPQSAELQLSPETKKVLFYASEESRKQRARFIGPEHLLVGLLREERSVAAEILIQFGLQVQDVRNELSRRTVEGTTLSAAKKESSKTPSVAEFTRDLTELAAGGKFDPLIGRASETERLIEILCRRTKNNPVLIGEAGVGKTAIVEGLAQRIAAKQVPRFLENKRLLSLDLSLIVAGTKYRGQFEERLKKIIGEVREAGDCIVFIDELHTLIGAGSAEGTLDAANILKPALSRGEMQCIGATTPSEFRKSIEKDRALERRFQTIRIAPPTEQEAIEIVKGVAERYEAFHQVRYTEEALEAAVLQSNRFISERFLPDKAIDVLDEAGARAKLKAQEQQDGEPSWTETIENWKRRANDDQVLSLEINSLEDILTSVEVSKTDVDDVISRLTGIPVSTVGKEETKKLLEIETELHTKIVSQRPAISALARAIRRSRAGLKNPKRPVGAFLFLGPTGVGKTEVARTLAKHLFLSESALIRFDMSEFMEKHSVSKFIGAPPGYIGYDEGGQLTDRLRRTPYSVVLFDEIEKAHPDAVNILLQVFEDGLLTDSQGNAVDCSHAIFVMTSNIGARQIQKRGRLGFQSGAEAAKEKLDEQVMTQVKQAFPPEFINRLDEVVIFDELTDEDLAAIVDLQLGDLNLLLAKQGLNLTMTDEARAWLLDQTAKDRNFGARPLKRALQKHVEDAISEAVIQGQVSDDGEIEIYLHGNELALRSTIIAEIERSLSHSGS
ncbi:MAG TPA: ATP-dependent Clp protease ATP-binding subunit [Pyrinomonadaceae bacterium]|nr:ATP-dependent Clp protease ATP-binding subunit [Pyrinomonadaceae bacterium]